MTAARSTLPAPEVDAWEDDSMPLYLIDDGGDLVRLGQERDRACGIVPGKTSKIYMGVEHGRWVVGWDEVECEGGSMFAALFELRQKLKAAIRRAEGDEP